MVTVYRNYVLYHSSCYDGFGAAFAAWTKLKDSATYIPVSYGKPMPEIEDGSIVYILDFHYEMDELKKLSERMIKVVLLDHHVSAMYKFTDTIEQQTYRDFDGNLEIHFDMTKSGAGMAWDYFHIGDKRPKMIDLIEDRDLWKFKYNDETKYLHSYLLSIPMDFSLYFNLTFDTPLKEAIEQGKNLLRMTDQIVINICKHSWVTTFHGYKVAMVNTSSHWSEVGDKLLDLHPGIDFAVSYTDMSDGIRMLSLRSRGDMDVSLVAKKLGGGGHKNAAGAKILNKELIARDLEESLKAYYNHKSETKTLVSAQISVASAEDFINFYRSLDEKTKA